MCIKEIRDERWDIMKRSILLLSRIICLQSLWRGDDGRCTEWESPWKWKLLHIYVYICVCTYTNIYIYREREREIARESWPLIFQLNSHPKNQYLFFKLHQLVVVGNTAAQLLVPLPWPLKIICSFLHVLSVLAYTIFLL